MSKPKFTMGAQLDIDNLDEKVVAWLIAEQRDIELDDFARPHVLDNIEPYIKQVQTLLKGHRGQLGIHGPVSTISFAISDPAVVEVIKRRFEQALRACEALGATHMVIHSPFLFLGAPNFMYNGRSVQDNQIRTAHHTLDGIVQMAEQIGCVLVIENTWDTDSSLLIDFVRSFDSNFVRLSIDTGHAYVTYNRYGGEPPDYWIRKAGNILGHVHLTDTDGYADRHWVPGKGNINWLSVFTELNQLEQNPRLILECRVEDRREAVFQQSAEWLHKKGWAR